MLTEAHKEVCRQAVEKFGRRRLPVKIKKLQRYLGVDDV